MSRHHAIDIMVINNRDSRGSLLAELFIKRIPVVTVFNPPIDARIGQGLMFTRWNGLNCSGVLRVSMRWFVV